MSKGKPSAGGSDVGWKTMNGTKVYIGKRNVITKGPDKFIGRTVSEVSHMAKTVENYQPTISKMSKAAQKKIDAKKAKEAEKNARKREASDKKFEESLKNPPKKQKTLNKSEKAAYTQEVRTNPKGKQSASIKKAYREELKVFKGNQDREDDFAYALSQGMSVDEAYKFAMNAII